MYVGRNMLTWTGWQLKVGESIMNLDYNIRKIPLSEKQTLQNLMQFYFYDFSEFVEAHVGEDGLFGSYPYLDDYWSEPDHRFPYLLELDGRLAGFVLVRWIETEEKNYFSIAEFFVMKKYRRFGLGKQVAKSIFELHKGEWEVFQIEKNAPAQSFWKNVIHEFTDGDYTESIKSGKVIQRFVS